MIEKIPDNSGSDGVNIISQLKPKQIKFTTNVDIGLKNLRQLFSGGDDPIVRVQACDACNQGGCIECLRGIVAFGTRIQTNSVEFEREAYKIINESDIPMRITYETIYEEIASQPGQENKPVDRQVFVEMDSRLKPFSKNTLKELGSSIEGATKYQVMK